MTPLSRPKPRRLLRLALSLFLPCLLSVAQEISPQVAASSASRPESSAVLDNRGNQFVKLLLAVGQHDGDCVDAYYGPTEWMREVERTKRPLKALRSEAEALALALAQAGNDSLPHQQKQRHGFLSAQVKALQAKIDLLLGAKMTFDEESRLLYDCVLPSLAPERAAAIRARLAELLPGSGALAERFERYENQFIVPKDRVEGLMKAAIAECRRRTLLHIPLPREEAFQMSFVKGKSWSAYNWYKGKSQSLIEINTDLPFRVSQALHLAAHEGYPGHHVYNVLLERDFAMKRAWSEFTIYPLFSPQSLIAEGTAEYGVDVVFPQSDLVAFAREVLFPLAGLDPSRAAEYFEVLRAKRELGLVADDLCRHHLDGKVSREETVRRMIEEAIVPKDQAEKLLDFAQHYRAYLTTYHTGYLLVKHYVEGQGGAADREARWKIFADLLSSPRMPSDLR